MSQDPREANDAIYTVSMRFTPEECLMLVQALDTIACLQKAQPFEIQKYRAEAYLELAGRVDEGIMNLLRALQAVDDVDIPRGMSLESN